MRIRVVQRTELRAEPALTAEVLGLLDPGDDLIVVDRRGEWIEVQAPGGKQGWVPASLCRPVSGDAPDIKRLAAMRQQAAATPIGAPKPQVIEEEHDHDFGSDSGGSSLESLSLNRDRGPGAMFESKRFSQRRDATRAPKPVPAAPPPAASDIVDVSVFGPQTVRAGDGCLIQVFLHTLEQGAAVASLARETDAASGRRGVKTLATEIARGTRVQVIFEGRGLGVDQAMQELTWRGEPDVAQFTVSAPADAAGKSFFPRILVLVNSVPVGAVTFALPATAAQSPPQPTVIRGDEARRYSYAFLSYSSRDRAEVLKRAQGLKAGRIDFFQDLLSLEPGDQWAPRLYQEIDRCDLFLLFWSSHAKQSPWVMKEVEYALARRKSSSGGIPDITPVIIEGPPPPSPPETLKDIHFNDALIYVLAAVEAEAQAPKPT